VQGLSVGAITGAATAGLVELEPDGDRQRAALLSVLAQAGGCAAGPLTAGALAQWAPEPRVLCYVVALVVIAATCVAALSIPEPTRASGRWEIQRPSVPSAIRVGFARASLTGAAVCSRPRCSPAPGTAWRSSARRPSSTTSRPQNAPARSPPRSLSCIYFAVAVSVIGVGVISTSLQSLLTAVAAFAAAIGATAVLTAGWHLAR
jgi:MFS family permease